MRGAGDRRARRRRATECEVPSGSGWRRRWWMAHPRETLARGARTYFRSALLNNSRFAASDGIAAVDRIVVAWHTVASRAMSPSPTRDPGVDRPSSPVVSSSTSRSGRTSSSSNPVDSAGDVPDVALDADGATADVPPSPAPPPPTPPAVRAPELKLRRPAPKNLTFWTRPRPLPGPPTSPEPEPVVESARSAPSPSARVLPRINPILPSTDVCRRD